MPTQDPIDRNDAVFVARLRREVFYYFPVAGKLDPTMRPVVAEMIVADAMLCETGRVDRKKLAQQTQAVCDAADAGDVAQLPDWLYLPTWANERIYYRYEIELRALGFTINTTGRKRDRDLREVVEDLLRNDRPSGSNEVLRILVEDYSWKFDPELNARGTAVPTMSKVTDPSGETRTLKKFRDNVSEAKRELKAAPVRMLDSVYENPLAAARRTQRVPEDENDDP